MVVISNSEVWVLSQKRNRDRERQENLLNGYGSDGKEIDRLTVVKKLASIQKASGLYGVVYQRFVKMASEVGNVV